MLYMCLFSYILTAYMTITSTVPCCVQDPSVLSGL